MTDSITKNGGGGSVDFRFKILYALGIIFIVAGHRGNGGLILFYDWFPPYAFHLGLFIFCSGYFYKSENEKRPFSYIWKKVKRLIIPLFLWNFVYAALSLLLAKVTNISFSPINAQTLFLYPMFNGHQFVFNLASWFVFPLFCAEVLNLLFRKLLFFVKEDIKLFICFFVYLAIGCGGVILAYNGHREGWFLLLDKVMIFMPFIGMGMLVKRFIEFIDKIPGYLYFGIIFLAQMIINIARKGNPTYTFAWCNDFDSDFMMPFTVGALGILFWLRVAKLLNTFLEGNKVVKAIADNTYSIMMHHMLGFFVFSGIVGLICKALPDNGGFDYTQFTSDVWYLYRPNGSISFALLYMIFAIAFSLFIHWMVGLMKKGGVKLFVSIKEKCRKKKSKDSAENGEEQSADLQETNSVDNA
ncbi:MAG: acyltransferase [Corallococcus sp.]|nr:acyltransferase [Corallococcus sp.]